ncbi:YrrS family protein [Halobacillus sp. B23F22_1]|uniref:YrrS family protein n=1 Tax=Halobacillus sp. B23F22_1 TaxID=3459514 RepID=UPI00373F5941
MKNNHTRSSRSGRFEKRNKTKKITLILTAAAVILLMVYIGLFTFTGGSGPQSEDTATQSENEEQNEENSTEDSEESEEDSQELEVKEKEKEEKEKEEKESSDEEEENENEEEESSEEEDDNREVEEGSEENVDRVITQDWDPVGTEQDTSGNHTTTFQQGSQDWNEIIKAASVATGVDSANMIEWRVENAGNERVNAVISEKSQDPVYRVLIEWVDGEGYRPVQVEELNNNPYN